LLTIVSSPQVITLYIFLLAFSLSIFMLILCCTYVSIILLEYFFLPKLIDLEGRI
jgi:antibiotic biosynthesis monooxygenase (ABM) superfamily enzyme